MNDIQTKNKGMRPIKTCSWEECESMCEGSTDYCGSHNSLIRKQARQESKVKIAVPVKKITAKHAKELADYGVLRRKYLQENPVCEAGFSVCDYVSIEVHHRAKRGKNLLDTSTFMAICRSCHDYIEFTMSAEERREKGLLLTKHETI